MEENEIQKLVDENKNLKDEIKKRNSDIYFREKVSGALSLIIFNVIYFWVVLFLMSEFNALCQDVVLMQQIPFYYPLLTGVGLFFLLFIGIYRVVIDFLTLFDKEFQYMCEWIHEHVPRMLHAAAREAFDKKKEE
jgi:hypothetical protein